VVRLADDLRMPTGGGDRVRTRHDDVAPAPGDGVVVLDAARDTP
jgi:hypothetical protein